MPTSSVFIIESRTRRPIHAMSVQYNISKQIVSARLRFRGERERERERSRGSCSSVEARSIGRRRQQETALIQPMGIIGVRSYWLGCAPLCARCRPAGDKQRRRSGRAVRRRRRPPVPGDSPTDVRSAARCPPSTFLL